MSSARFGLYRSISRLSRLTKLALQEFSQSHGIVVVGITGTVDQRYRAATSSLNNRPPGLRVGFQFLKVAAAELIPLGRIVTEPLPQLRTWSYIFKPALNLERGLLYS